MIIGGMQAILQEKLNMNGVQTTIHGAAPLMIVNGPYARTIGLTGARAVRWMEQTDFDRRARELIDPRNDLRCVHEVPHGVARIDALGRIAKKEVDAAT